MGGFSPGHQGAEVEGVREHAEVNQLGEQYQVDLEARTDYLHYNKTSIQHTSNLRRE